MQLAFIEQLQTRAAADERIRAAWLEGSFGRGIADDWSDVDAHLLIKRDALDSFREAAEAWLTAIRPLVLFRRMFGGEMMNAMTDQGLRLDVWLHGDEQATVTEGRARVLIADPETLVWQPAPSETLSETEAAAELMRAIPEFWRCVALLPVSLGRNERLISAAGNFLIVLLLADVLALASRRRKDRGVKALNDYLVPADRERAEAAVHLQTLKPAELTRFTLRLAAIMQDRGPAICQKWHVTYPQNLEDSVLRYVTGELRQFHLDECLELLQSYPEN